MYQIIGVDNIERAMGKKALGVQLLSRRDFTS